MNDIKKQALDQIKNLFDSQAFAVLSTQKNGQPYANLVAVAATDDLEEIIFLTPNTTRKYENLTDNSKVAILINDSRNEADDINKAVCVTATGTATIAENQERKKLLNLFIKRHPHLTAFSAEPTTVLVCVAVDTFFVVSQFQNVLKIQVSP